MADGSDVAHKASGVFPVYAKELTKLVEDRDWEGGWETWNAIQVSKNVQNVQFSTTMALAFSIGIWGWHLGLAFGVGICV